MTMGRREAAMAAATASMAAAGAGAGLSGSRATAGSVPVCSSGLRATSLGSAMWTGPIRGSMLVRSARRTLASVSSPSRVRASLVKGR